MIISDSPCYLCQRRALGCHSQCPRYIAFARYRQALSKAKHGSSHELYEQQRQEARERRTRIAE